MRTGNPGNTSRRACWGERRRKTMVPGMPLCGCNVARTVLMARSAWRRHCGNTPFLSSYARGIEFERRVHTVLSRFGMDLARVGGAGDEGIDLQVSAAAVVCLAGAALTPAPAPACLWPACTPYTLLCAARAHRACGSWTLALACA